MSLILISSLRNKYYGVCLTIEGSEQSLREVQWFVQGHPALNIRVGKSNLNVLNTQAWLLTTWPHSESGAHQSLSNTPWPSTVSPAPASLFFPSSFLIILAYSWLSLSAFLYDLSYVPSSKCCHSLELFCKFPEEVHSVRHSPLHRVSYRRYHGHGSVAFPVPLAVAMVVESHSQLASDEAVGTVAALQKSSPLDLHSAG